MQPLDLWRLNDILSVVQAGLLIAGHDPAKHAYVEELDVHERPAGYEAIRTSLKNAILSEKLSANIKYRAEYTHFESQEGGVFIPEYDMDLTATTVNVVDLTNFLSGKGYKEGFFFTENKDQPDYLNPQHPCYSAKLATSIEAWQAVSANAVDLPLARSVKKTLTNWLRTHANRLELTKSDGRINELAIDEIAKVANWDTKGGAPKTPVRLAKSGEPTQKKPPDISQTIPPVKHMMQDEIPH